MSMLENIRRIGIFMIAAQTVMHFAAGKQYEKYMKIIAGVIVLALFISPFVSSSENVAALWQEEVERMTEQMEKQMARQMESQSSMQGMPYGGSSVESEALRQIEEEMKSRFNEMIADGGYRVADVAVELDETKEHGGRELTFRRVRIALKRVADNAVYSTEENMNDLSDISMNTGEESSLDGSGKGQSDNSAGETIQIEQIIVGEEKEEGTVQRRTAQKAASQKEEQEQNQAQDADMQEYRRIFAQMLGIAQDRVEVTWDGEW